LFSSNRGRLDVEVDVTFFYCVCRLQFLFISAWYCISWCCPVCYECIFFPK